MLAPQGGAWGAIQDGWANRPAWMGGSAGVMPGSPSATGSGPQPGWGIMPYNSGP